MSESVREVLETVASDPEALDVLRENPDELAEEIGLDEAELDALRASDYLLVSRRRNPLAADTTITLGTTTITADPSLGPNSLEDLDYDRLIDVTRRMAMDPAYADRVRTFLNR